MPTTPGKRRDHLVRTLLGRYFPTHGPAREQAKLLILEHLGLVRKLCFLERENKRSAMSRGVRVNKPFVINKQGDLGGNSVRQRVHNPLGNGA